MFNDLFYIYSAILGESWKWIENCASSITFSGYTQSQKIVNYRIKILGIMKTTMSSQESQTRLRSSIPDRRDPYVWYVGGVWGIQRGGQNQ